MLLRLLFLVILNAYILPQDSLAQYELPKDNRYWKYHNWYVSHSIVNLVVSGKDEQHLAEAIEEIPKLKRKGALVGDVIVIGKPEKEEQFNQLSKDLSYPKMESSEDLVKKYKINYSPTWIVRYRGKDYVFEGLRLPQNLFTSGGEFRDDDSLARSNAKIATHKIRKTSHNFISSEKLPNQDKLPEFMRGVDLPVPAYLFSASLPVQAGEYDGLPACSENNLRYIPRLDDESFKSLDIVVYQFNDEQQKLKAQSYGYKAVPFIEGALSNPYRPQGDVAQTVIRALPIECLPTRVRSVSKESQKAFELRQGSIAWKKEEKKAEAGE